MNTNANHADELRTNRARALAAQHRIAEAEALYRDILKTLPDTPEALNFVAMCALARGEFRWAQRDLEHAAALDSSAPEIWTNLGIVHLGQHRSADALEAFDRALGLEPMHVAARLHRGTALEQRGRVDAATAAYFGALVTAQSHGQWRNDATTPPGLRPAVKHAIAFVEANRKRIFMHLLAPLRARYGASSLARIENGLLIYLGEREADYPDARQYCKFFYVPGLRATPYYEPELFAWYANIEAHIDDIRAELNAVMERPIGLEPFLGTNDNAVLKKQQLLEGTRGDAQWNSFFFHRHGQAFEQHARRCPRTMELLASVPMVHIRGHAPEALFSILAPGSHILKHHGITNTRLVTHLPLITPEGCAIRVGGVEHSWEEGHLVTFDDTFEHESWNRSDKVRANLMFDVWHPELDEAERAAITLLVEGIGDFSQKARVAPPPAD